MKICTTVTNVAQVNDFYEISTDGVPLRIWFVTDDCLRIRAGFSGTFEEASYSLALTAWPDRLDTVMQGYRKRVAVSPSALADGPNAAVLQGNSLKVVVEKQPFRICVYDKQNTLLHADLVDLAYMQDSNSRRIHTSEIMPGDCFYGFGEKTGPINKAEKFMSMSPKDALGYNPKETDSLYKHIPFYIKLNRSTKKACGYFYHNTYECDFDMGREKSNYWRAHSRYRTDGGDIDLFLLAGPSVRKVISGYTDLTGKSVMLPRYALGYLGSSMYYPELPQNADDAILHFIDTTRKKGIPVDGFQLSSGYCTQQTPAGQKRCVFTWNDKRFKNPSDFFAKMQAKGVNVSPNVKPGVLLVHPKLAEMKAKGLFVQNSSGTDDAVGIWWGGKGHFADFTKPQARAAWKQMLTETVLAKGTASVWNDNCEYDSLIDKDSLCDYDGAGGTIGSLKAVMSNLMCQITCEAIEENTPNVRPYVVCRSGHSGIQRYAQTWAGDNFTSWDSLRYNIATILGMSVSGVANQGCDIGGFAGPSPEPELFVRWVQNGVFQPRFSIHSVNSDNTVTEPWMYSACTGYIRDAICLRYRLMPYLYSLMQRAHVTGLPIAEPMFSAFQHDTACYEEGVNFMLGDALLVASVVEKGAVTRAVYLPENEVFYDFYTRQPYAGGQTISLPVSLGSMPLFVRGGSIVPLAQQQLHNLLTEKETHLRLLCADDASCEFTLYEDDGISLNYKQGDYLKTQISLQSGEITTLQFAATGSYQTAVQQVSLDIIHPAKSPYWVKLGAAALPRYLDRVEYEAATTGWYYSQSLKSVQVKYANPLAQGKQSYCVTISYEEFDMLGM